MSSKSKFSFLFFFLLITLISCSSANELEGRWEHINSRNDINEYVITSKTLTYSFVYGGKHVSTKPYKLFEKGQSYIVLEIAQENNSVERKKLLRFDLISKDQIFVDGKIFTRVK